MTIDDNDDDDDDNDNVSNNSKDETDDEEDVLVAPHLSSSSYLPPPYYFVGGVVGDVASQIIPQKSFQLSEADKSSAEGDRRYLPQQQQESPTLPFAFHCNDWWRQNYFSQRWRLQQQQQQQHQKLFAKDESLTSQGVSSKADSSTSWIC